jgi:type II secretory pathway pseudopilin PulG
LFEGLRRWKIVAPELTPRDVIENTTNEINKINSRVTSLRSAMDNLGVDSPEDELKLIQLERSNPQLFPGDVQAWVAVLNMVQTMQAQQAQIQATQQALQAPQQAALGVSPLAASESGAAAAQNTAFEMQPALGQDMNQAGPTQPMTAPGGPPPQGTNAPGTLPSSLVRSTPTGQATSTQQVIIPGRR